MFKIFFTKNRVLLILFFLINICRNLIAQDLYNPTEIDFFNAVNSKKISWIKFNNNGSFHYVNKNLDLNGIEELNFLFTRNENIYNEFVIENLDFSNCGQINFWLRHAVKINFENCNFNFRNDGGIKFYFENSDLLYNNFSGNSEITISNCTFNNPDLSKIQNKSGNQIFFGKDPYAEKSISDNYRLKNIKIIRSNFYASKYSDNLAEHYYSLMFYKQDATVSYQNIQIENSVFRYSDFNNGIADAINFSNKAEENFRIFSEKTYSENSDIKIINNSLFSDSQKPGHAIFIHGPFSNINILNNYIDGFGLNMEKDNLTVARDGAIHLYGARQVSPVTLYSDNNIDITIRSNVVKNCPSTGIRVSGFTNCDISQNSVEISEETQFWKNFITWQDKAAIEISTGDYSDTNRQSLDVLVTENTLLCKNESIGILIKFVKDFEIYDNKIFDPISYGILYFANNSVAQSDIGKSSIMSNLIDMRKINFNDMNSGFFNKNFGIKYAGISYWKETKSKPSESLLLKNNKIEIADSLIKKMYFNNNLKTSDNITIEK